LKGLFINTAKANCSIHESGKMCYDCLKLSDTYSIAYHEVDEVHREISLDYDFYIFNYHAITMAWLDTGLIRDLPGLKATIVLEVLPGDPFVMCPENDFDAYIVLDPTLRSSNPKVYTFPRPLENIGAKFSYVEKEIPEIGTFGFATDGKGFDKVIEAVNREFDEAIVKINIPKGDYVLGDKYDQLVNYLNDYPTKQGVKVKITSNFFNKEELIEWCSQNTLNMFLYNRNLPGLSATTDQAITSGRPLVVSTDNTFRHIHQYIKPYPFQNLKNAIINTPASVLKIQKDWAPINFALKFEKLLADYGVKHIKKSGKSVALPIKDNQNIKVLKPSRFKKADFIPPIIFKAYRKIFPKAKASSHHTLQPFVHDVLQSFSQFNEDLLIDMLLGQKEKGFYIDIGANDPIFNSNTQKFYTRGWHGINIEPNLKAFINLKDSRPRDINLNVAISDSERELVFYYLSDDSTLSTLDQQAAEKMAKMLNLELTSGKVKTNSLKNILDQELKVNEIDFMSVDAEGHDLVVLKSNDWDKYRAAVLMVESNNEFAEIRSYMDSKDYLHIYSNFYNAIFVNKHTANTALLKNIKWEA